MRNDYKDCTSIIDILEDREKKYLKKLQDCDQRTLLGYQRGEYVSTSLDELRYVLDLLKKYKGC
jgi:hypothetical protein